MWNTTQDLKDWGLGKGELTDERFEELSGTLLPNLGEQIARWRSAKKITDEILGDWAERNRDKLRHVGMGSTTIRDLWITVHEMVVGLLAKKTP